MSLLSIDITKVGRLSLREVKLPTIERRVDPTPIQVDRPLTAQEIAYKNAVDKNPFFNSLVKCLGLVIDEEARHNETPDIWIEPGKKPPIYGIVDIPAIAPPEPNIAKLTEIVGSILEPENNYSGEEVIERIKEATNVSQERAESGFKLMVSSVVLTEINKGRYCLTGSTPF